VTDGRTDRQTELQWLRHTTIAVAAVAVKIHQYAFAAFSVIWHRNEHTPHSLM